MPKRNDKKNDKSRKQTAGGMKTEAKNGKGALPKTVSDSIPYLRVYENGLIEIKPGWFSMSYVIPDANFAKASENRQMEVAEQWSRFLCTFDSDVDIEVTLFNREMDDAEFREKIFLGMRPDDANEYRVEYNKMLEDKLFGAKNNLETVKILTISLKADDAVNADEKFVQISSTVAQEMANMTKVDSQPMKITERLDLLNQIMKGRDAKPLGERRMIDGHLSEAFTLENCAAQGISTKEVIAPASFEFTNNLSKVGDRLMKTYCVSSYPTYIKGTILTDFAKIPANLLVSVYFTPFDQQESLKMLKEKSVNINSEIVDAQKKAARSGVFGDATVGSGITNAQHEISELMDRMNRDDMRLFTTTFLFTLFADDEAEMKRLEDQLRLMAGKNLLQVQPLNFQQEAGFASSLPLCNNRVFEDRLMTSVSVASIIPFDVKEIRQDGGKYYGLNAVSGNMILYNRAEDVNPNACILGMPGAGKSFLSKQEITDVLLGTDDYVYILDPEREYKILAERFGGTTIELSPNSNTHINPFDLNIENSEDAADPVKVKSDFIEGLVEIMVGGRLGLSATEKSIIGRSVFNIYEPYVKHLRRMHKSYDPATAPTIWEFYNDLNSQGQMEASNLSLSLERFVKGSQNAFSYRTNVNVDNRFVVYDTKDIGAGLKEPGQYIALDNIFNKIIDNFSKGIRTWLYVDEFHNLMQKDTSGEYIQQIWKRARKWNGVPCAITQNVEDMLKSESARTVINNSNLVIVLGQSAINRKQLSDMLEISPEEQKYISTIKPGMGIMHFSSMGCNVPLLNEFPKDTELYRIMSTKADERLGGV